MYVRDLALTLADNGFSIACYSPKLGDVADELRSHGIEVVADLRDLTHAPDLIHAHHFTAGAAALFTFPQTPALFVCHGLLPWPETPLVNFKQIQKFVAVDQASKDRLMQDLGLQEGEVTIIQNGIDLQRFCLKRVDDPSRNKRALVFSNQAQNASIIPLQEACAINGIHLDVRGFGVGDPVEHPEKILNSYGLVFAKGRAAMEAMACGCNVILADYGKWGELVTPENWLQLRKLNFGLYAIDRELDKNAIAKEISMIKWEHGRQLAQLVSDKASLEQMVEQLLCEYNKIMKSPVVLEKYHLNEAAEYVQTISPLFYERDELATRLYEETKLRLGNEATNAGLLVQAMVTLRDGPDQILVRRLAKQVLTLQPGHPIALDVLGGETTNA